MSKIPKRNAKPQLDPLREWQEWVNHASGQPERSYNPHMQRFLAGVLGYPLEKVLVEGRVEGGYPDLQLLTQEGDPWVVGDLKLDDTYLSQPDQADKLWQEKSKYVSGLTRYVLFLTPRYLQLRRADGQVLKTLYLPSLTLDQLRQELCEISWEKAQHESQWARLVEGKLPYGYLKLDAEGTKRLKEDLRASFGELMEAAEKALEDLERRYQEYRARLADAEKSFGGASEDTRRRALARIEGKYPTALKALFTAHLPRFVDQYGGEIEGKLEEGNPRIREAFAADSAAALMARVLFLRFLEDLGLTKRRLTNGGPERWGAFVESLAKSAAALVKVSSMDLKGAYQEPFEEETFAWVLEVNGQMDQALQRLILRVNAYNFQELSEEVLGEIYQDFLPPEKRKRLGEFYTPSFIVDYILRETALAHPDDELPEVLDPACGSGSFLVRYFHQVVEEHRKRGLEVDLERLRETIWGFDINPFASYISTFQLLWGQLRVDSKSRPKVHVYNLNALVRDDHISAQIGKEHLTPGELARDEKKWSYVVGNPPYIRAERIKYGEEMQNLYHHVWGPNGDTGLIFLWRSLQDWLKEGGKLGMVVSGGYASSEAAAKVWSLLWPGQGYALRKLVWLEFGGKVWEANVIPMVLIIERTPAREDDVIEIWVPQPRSKATPDPQPQEDLQPQEDPQPQEIARIRYADFFDPRVNPTSPPDPYGQYLLPLLKAEDVGLLRRLYPNGGAFTRLTEAMKTQHTRHKKPQPYWWTYGVQRGGAEATPEPIGKNSVRAISGRDLAVAYIGEPAGYVDLDAVRTLSLWSDESPDQYLAIAEIGFCPFGALVRNKDNKGLVALNTLVVGVPKDEENLGEALAAYLNSSLVRWYYLVRLRSGVLEGSHRAHIYPRTLESLPWPRNPDPAILECLAELYRQLEELARASREHPYTWLAGTVEERRRANRGYPLASKRLGVDFRGWSQAWPVEDIAVVGDWLGGGLFAQLKLPDEELARYVKLLLQGLEAGTLVESRILQKLWVADDYKALLQEYDQRMTDFRTLQQRFQKILEDIDQAVFDLFGLSAHERDHIRERLGSFPLNQLRPRYPWEVEEARLPRSYTSDRFGS